MKPRPSLPATLAALVVPWLLAGYAGYHLWNSNYGMQALRQNRQLLAQEQALLLQQQQQNRLYEARVAALRDEGVSRDTTMLAEQVRRVLSYSHPDEIIVPAPAVAPGN